MRVGVICAWLQVRGMLEQPVQNVGRLADVARDDLGIEGPPEIRDMGVHPKATASRREVLRMKGSVERTERDTVHAGTRTES